MSRYRSIFLFLDNAIATGRLGSGAPDHAPGNIVWSVFTTLPGTFLLFQFVWSWVVIGIAYALSDSDQSTLSTDFWKTKLSVSKSVTYGVGWGLFALLGFFVTDSAKRFFQGQHYFHRISAEICRIVRILRQTYPRGTWHPGDHDRIVAHLAAYPIALKMTLRDEAEPEQLRQLLDPADAEDVVREGLHFHCSKVVRSYFSAAEDDGVDSFEKYCTIPKTLAGSGARFVIMGIIDNLDGMSGLLMRIARIRPAVGYVNHLRIFLYIWLMFLPLSMVSTSGWFTILWSLLITYGICMMFTIARALNQPFGFDAVDIKMNHLCAESAKEILNEYASAKLDIEECIDKEHKTPVWLEKGPPNLEYDFSETLLAKESNGKKLKRKLKPRPIRLQITMAMLLFFIWCAFIVFLTWGVTRGDDRVPKTRWWSVYIPVNSDTTSFVSLGLFLLLSFWLSDAYSRYWDGLQSWQSSIRPGLENIALQIAVANHRGTWHERDRERIFSFLAAIPYAVKMYLRDGNRLEVDDLVNILAEKDLRDILEAPNPINYVFGVLYAYLNSADAAMSGATTLNEPAYGMTAISLTYGLMDVEKAVDDCISIKVFPISTSFTLHLRLFTIFWLALLPLTLVINDGFVSFLYLLPISYSIINLLVIGDELSNPFGGDLHDIPLDQFCHEIRDSIHRLYHSTNDVRNLIQSSEYDRLKFKAKRRKFEVNQKPIQDVELNDERPPYTMVDFLTKVYKSFPRVSIVAMSITTIWTVIAVFLSWGLSKLWDDDRNNGLKYGWASPIDVESGVLGNVGFALFLILAFRANDGIKRYDDAAQNLSVIGMHLRNFGVQIVQSFAEGSYHQGDKERIIAHLVQIPLCFRDILLGCGKGEKQEYEGLLSEEDRKLFENSPSPLEHLINTVHAYAVIQDNKDKRLYMEKPFTQAGPASMLSIIRISEVRSTIAEAIGVKRFPVVPSYKHHQHLFSLLWLMLLPLSMTSKTGFFTILWSPIIAYSVFALEEIASKLVDPLGDDLVDIPVNDLCVDISNSILEGVNSVRWNCDYHTQSSPKDMEPGIGAVLKGNEVEDKYTLSFLDARTLSVDIDEFDDISESKQDLLSINGPHEPKPKPSLFSHFVHSVPWWAIVFVLAWTTIACLISFQARKRRFDELSRWWVSFVSVDTSVATVMSIGTFALLGFYTNAAFRRYQMAGSVWGDKLRATCHTLTTLFLSYTHSEAFHKEDHERIIGHLAAIPLVLKSQLHDRHDLREVRGFLSHQDVGRIQCSPNMAAHCIDVLRSYMLKLMCHGATVNKQGWPGPVSCALFLRNNLQTLEECVRLSFFLKDVPIAAGALNLLQALLIIWFTILPFVLAEKSGWFTIFWMLFIAYGLIGMYAIANEIQNPFGNDINDFDLDTMAKVIVTDIVSVWKEQKNGFDNLVCERPVPDCWRSDLDLVTTQQENDDDDENDDDENDGQDTKGEDENLAKVDSDEMKRTKIRSHENGESLSFFQSIRLGANGVDWWMLLGVILWATVAIVIAYFVGREFPSPAKCEPWFCSPIAIDSSIKKYIGFALFLLLGFRLHDSHGRYMQGNDLWYIDLVGFSNIPAIRIMQSYRPGTFHPGDKERMIGHIAAYPVCLLGTLHSLQYKDQLLELLNEEDVNSILSSPSPVDRCADVLWAYLRSSERFVKNPNARSPISFWEHRVVCRLIQSRTAASINCKQIVNIPMPYGYVQHLRIFLFIWVVLLPFGLVESSGWVSILWVSIIAYGVIAIERWAHELSDPFGFDLSDVDIERASSSIVDYVKGTFSSFNQGLDSFIIPSRHALQDPDNKMHAVES